MKKRGTGVSVAKSRMSESNKTLNTLSIHMCGEKVRGKAAVF